MNNNEIRIKIIQKAHNLLDNPEALWHRLYQLKPCMMMSLDNQVCLQNSLLTLTLKFNEESPLNMNISYSLKDNQTKEIEYRDQGRVQDVDFFIDCLNALTKDVMIKIIFNPQVDWELLSILELQTLVVPKIRILKEKIRNFSENDELAKQIQIESELNSIKSKLQELSDPEAKKYAELIDIFET